MNQLHIRGDVLDQEAFPLPQPGLFADFALGMGVVNLAVEFQKLPCATRLGILADWQKGIELERLKALVGLFGEVTSSMAGVPLPKRIAHFREVCGQLGIECPANVALHLQQF